jgi:hypothetical protein
MAVEAKRGCGYRKVGGLYLVGSGGGIACDRLPIAIEICKCCGQGIKQTRGWTWVDIAGLVGGDHFIATDVNGQKHTAEEGGRTALYACGCHQSCPLCHNVASMGRGGLLWIGTQFYSSVEMFEAEVKALGVSRRITTLPRDFKLGETWVLLAHPKGVIKPCGDLQAKYVPAIFRVWKPERIERIYKEGQRDSEAVQADIKRGITPVFVPDNDKDHQGSVYDKEDETQPQTGSTTPALFN